MINRSKAEKKDRETVAADAKSVRLYGIFFENEVYLAKEQRMR
jgi:hypothetical protein